MQSYTLQAGPVCANAVSTGLSNGPCSSAQISAGDVTEASTINFGNTRMNIVQIPAAAVAPGSQAIVNIIDEYPDPNSPTGVSYINAHIPLSQFATTDSVTSETSRASTAESALATSVTTESGRAEAAEAGLSAGITSETARAVTAEAGFSTGLANETVRAQSAEAGLSADITRESSRAQLAEAGLGSAITAETQAREAAIDQVTKGYRQATALAIALSGAGVLPGKKLNLTFNMGSYEGQSAVSAQGEYLVNEHAMLNVGVSGSTSGGGAGVRAGFTVGW